MRCPNCRLINPDTALRCDCGYDFTSGQMKESHLSRGIEASGGDQFFSRMLAASQGAKGWLKFLGVISIIAGTLSALTIIGIVVAWLPIWQGVLLFQAGSQIDAAITTEDSARLVMMMNKLRVYFVILGILMLIGLIGAVIVVLVAGGAIFALLQGLQG